MSKRITKKMLEEGKRVITSDLLLVVGLCVNENGYIVNTDTCQVFEYNGKQLRSTLFGNQINHHGDLEFDILNTRLITTLFNYVLARSTSEDGIYYRLSYEEKINIPNCEYQKSRLRVGSSNGELISEYYFNDTFKYIDIIHRICDNGIDNNLINKLSIYDYIEYKTR